MTTPTPDAEADRITNVEMVATKFKLGRLINHCTGVYNMPKEEIEQHKREIIEAVRRMG